MKKKISRILGVGLTVALLVSMLVMAAPASAGTLSWSAESSVTDLKANTSFILAPAGVSVVDFAIDGSNIYAVTSNVSNQLLKSSDGGMTWSNLHGNLSTSIQLLGIKAVATARDTADTVAILTSDDQVIFSTNGGATWTDINTPDDLVALTINAIDISPDGTYIAAAGDNGSATAQLYTIQLAMAQSWTRRITVANPGFETQDAIFAVQFSPNFGTDRIISVVSGNTTTGEARFQVFRYESGAFTWNGNITFFDSTDWAGGINLGSMTGGLAAADIELADSYLGNDTGSRLGFIALAATTASATIEGVKRIDDTLVVNFQTWSSGDEGPIGSIAYNESGKLLAGDFNSNQVYVALSPLASSPKFERLNSLKQPGGTTMVTVGWAGANAVAATQGDESAFAISTDDGYSFNDTSLINTMLSVVDDVAVSADGSVVYMSSHSADNDTSIWLKDGAWSRVYSDKDNTATTAAYIVRVAPENSSVVYIASKGTQDLWVSKDMGKTTWNSRPAYNLGTADTILDFVVGSADVAYAIDDDGVSKTSNAGLNWGSQKRPTDSFVPAMIALAPNGDVLVGGSDGYVAFSKDAGATFTRTKITVAGNVHVAADDGYATNNILYAGVGTKVYRGKADSTTAWASRSPSVDSTHAVVGLVQQGGIVYALTSNSTDAALFRSLTLETAGTTETDTWSSKTTTSTLNNTPQALKVSTGSVKLWAVDAAATLASFTDTIADVAPTQSSPANGFSVAVNTGTGEAYNVAFTIVRQSTSISAIEIEVAVDSAFAGIVWNAANPIAVTTDTTTKIVGPTASSPYTAQFMPGETYYWRTRAVTPLYSPWSATRTFKIEQPVAFVPVSPVVGATDVSITPTMVWAPYDGAIHYEITVSKDADFTFAEYSHNVPVENTFYKSEELDYDTTYYWRVRGVTGTTTGKTAAPGGPWTIGVFTTMAEPVEEVPPVVVEQPGKTEIKIVEVPVPGPVVQQAIPDYLLWVVIIIGAVLIVALIVLIVRTRRVA